MTRHERRQKLESFGRGPALLSVALRNFPKKMWLHRPGPDRWSIHEMIHHLADSEASGYLQCRSCIVEPGSRVLRWDAERWADSLGYFHQSTREALEIIRRLRKMTYQLLVNLPESAWSCAVADPNGGGISLERWLEDQERHIPEHIDQMQEIYAGWVQDTSPAKSLRALRQALQAFPQARSLYEHAIGRPAAFSMVTRLNPNSHFIVLFDGLQGR